MAFSLAEVDAALGFTEQAEGFRSTAYPDLVTGQPLIGYGTLLDERARPGVRRQLADIGFDLDALASGRQSITPDDAARIKQASMADYERLVDRTFGPLPPNKRQALIDMAYQSWNRGFTPELVQAVKSGDDATASAIIRSTYRNDPNLPGLRTRAEDRSALFAGRQGQETLAGGFSLDDVNEALKETGRSFTLDEVEGEIQKRPSFLQSIGAGIQQGIVKPAGGLTAGVGETIGSESIEQAGRGLIQSAEEGTRSRMVGSQDWRNIKSGGDLYHYIAENFGLNSPQMAAIIGTGIAAQAVIPPAGLPGILAKIGAFGLGAGAASLGLFTGLNVARQVEEGQEPQLGTAAAYAVPQAAADVLLTRALGFVGGDKLVRAATGPFLERVGKKVAEVLAVGVPGEVAQQILERAAASLPLNDDKAWSEYLDAAVGAVAFLGPVGAISAVPRGGRAQEPAREADIPPPPPDATIPEAGQTIGLRMGEGPPIRATIESYSDDGRYAFVRTDDGAVEPLLTAELVRDITEPPPVPDIPGETRAEGPPVTLADSDAIRGPADALFADIPPAGPLDVPEAAPSRPPAFTPEQAQATEAARQARALGPLGAVAAQQAAPLPSAPVAEPVAAPRPPVAQAPAAPQNVSRETIAQPVPPAPPAAQPPVPVSPPTPVQAAPMGRRRIKGKSRDMTLREDATLIRFLASRGGIQDEGGELRAMDAHKAFVPGFGKLVRPGGMDLDTAREAAAELGYIPEGTDTRELLAAIERDLSGQPVYARQGVVPEAAQKRLDAEAAARDREAMEADAQAWGIDLTGMKPQDALTRMFRAREEREGLTGRAEAQGIEVRGDWTNDELRAEVEEREALAGEPTLDADSIEQGVDEAAQRLPFDRETRDGDFDVTRAGPESQAATRYPQAQQPAPDAGETAVDRAPEAQGQGPDPVADRGEPTAVEGSQRPVEPPLLDAPEETPDQIAARARARQKDEAEAGMLGRKPLPKGQESAEDTPLFGGPRQGDLLGKGQPYRPEVTQRDSRGRPVRRESAPTEDQTQALIDAIDQRIDERVAQMSDTGGRDPIAPLAQAAGRVEAPPPGSLRELSTIGLYTAFPRGLAALDSIFARYWNAWKKREDKRHELEVEFAEGLRNSANLSEPDKRALETVQEHDRLNGIDRRDTGRRIVAQVDGQMVALSEEATRAYFSDKATFRKGWDLLIESTIRRRGYQGEISEQALSAALAVAQTGGRRAEAAALERDLEIFRMMEGQRRVGYVPLMRYGDHYVMVRSLQEPGTTHFELVDTKKPFSSVLGRTVQAGTIPDAVQRKIAELRRQYPERQYEIVSGPLTKSVIDRIDIPALEKLAMAVAQDDPQLYETVYGEFMGKIYDHLKAGFRKKSENIPGYSKDFERAKADYFRHLASVVSRNLHEKEIKDGYEATQKHRNQNVRRFAESFEARMNSPASDWAAMRKYGFFMFLAGSPAAATVNLSQTPLVSIPNLATWAGTPRAAGLVSTALAEVMTAVRIGDRGMTLDISRLGRTEAERAMLRKLERDGTLQAQLTHELRGGNATENRALRPYARAFDKTFDILASMFGTAEMVNRATIALAAFRAANNQSLRDKAAQVYAKNELFKTIMRSGNLTAENLAKFMVDETQYVAGKVNRQRIATGPGAALLQFKSFGMNYLRNMAQLATRMGPEGKLAAFLMLSALVAMSGLYGFPFAEDAMALGEWATKMATGVDHDFDRKLRQIISEFASSNYAAEMMVRGPWREFAGIEMGKRLGQGDLIPRLELVDVLGVPVAGTIGKAKEVLTRWQNDQPLGAVAAALPKFAGDAVKMIAQGTEGVQTMRGAPVLKPSEISTGERIAKGIGFTSAGQARRYEEQFSQRRVAGATREGAASLYTALAKNQTFAADARAQGDEQSARRYEERFQTLWNRNEATLASDIPDYQKILIRGPALRRRMQQMADPDAFLLKTAPKMAREELMRSPYVNEARP